MRKLFAVYVLAGCLGFAGCNDPYGTAAKLAQDVAVSIGQSEVTIDSFRAQGTLTADEERSILGYLDSLNVVNGQYIVCVQAAHGQTAVGGFTACVNKFKTALGDPATLAALHIKNAAKQAEVTAVAAGIVTLATTTITALGGK